MRRARICSRVTETEMEDEEQVVEFKKARRRGNIRKRDEPDADGNAAAGAGDQGDEDDTAIVSAAKRQKVGLTTASTKAAGPSKDDSVNFAFASVGATSLASKDEKIFSQLETETERDKDATAIYQRNAKLRELAEDAADGDVYRGMGAYKQYVKTAEPSRTAGPLRTTTHVRMSVRFDYQPDICKDYKETGYCGYGDNCKFMHDRGDYKAGWQIDKEWDEQQKVLKDAKKSGGDEAAAGEEELPFACFICRQPFKDPVVTRCGHYFCEDCALKHHDKDKRCFACKEPTLGIFNSATKILKRLEEQKKRKEELERESDTTKAAEEHRRRFAAQAEDQADQKQHLAALMSADEENRPAVV